MGKIIKNRFLNIIFSLIIFFLLWQLVVELGLVNRIFLPPPSSFFPTVEKIGPSLLSAIGETVWHFGVSFILGGMMGVIGGLLVGYYAFLERTIGALLSAIFPVPRLTFLPLFILLLGLNDKTIVALGIFSMFFIMYMNTFSGVKKVDKKYIEVYQNLGGRFSNIFQKVIIPLTLPFILTGLRYSLGRVLSTIIVTEMLIGQKGMGGLLWKAVNLFQPEVVVALQIVIILFAISLFWIFDASERKLTPWIHKDGGNT